MSSLSLSLSLSRFILYFSAGEYEPDFLKSGSDLPALEPLKTIVEGVEWREGEWAEVDGVKTWTRHSRLVFPDSFTGQIETDVNSP